MKARIAAALLVLAFSPACSPQHEPAVAEVDPVLAELLRDVPEAVLSDPLLRESVTGNADGVRRLLKQGRAIDAALSLNEVLMLVVNQSQCTPGVVTALVEGGADPEWVEKDTGKSVLLMAAGSGAGDCFRTLLALGADPTLIDVNGYGAVSLTYLSRDLSLFDWVLGSQNIAPKHPEDLNKALRAALLGEDWASCRKLIEAGAELKPLDDAGLDRSC